MASHRHHHQLSLKIWLHLLLVRTEVKFTKLMHKNFFKNKKTKLETIFFSYLQCTVPGRMFSSSLVENILCRMRYLSGKHVLLFSLHNQNQQLPEEGNSYHGLLLVIVNNGYHFWLSVTCRLTVGRQVTDALSTHYQQSANSVK